MTQATLSIQEESYQGLSRILLISVITLLTFHPLLMNQSLRGHRCLWWGQGWPKRLS